jgi:GNAT superfamily N-acetyltransferase
MTVPRLRAHYLPEASEAVYATAVADSDTLIGNVFACRWSYQGRTVLWITQLVVRSDFRRKGVATRMLKSLVKDGDEIFGVLSSHPAALKALSRAVGGMSP